MLNNITLMGRLVKDPELRTTNSGKSVVGFTVAVDRDYGDKETDFIDCKAWGTTAEFINKFFSKGRAIALTGSLQSSKWTDQQGNKRTSWAVNVQSVYFADSKKTEPGSQFEEADAGDLPF